MPPFSAHPPLSPAARHSYYDLIRQHVLARLDAGRSDDAAFDAFDDPPLPGVALTRQLAMRQLVEVACNAFLFGDLLRAALELMAGALGSFGLVEAAALDPSRLIACRPPSLRHLPAAVGLSI